MENIYEHSESLHKLNNFWEQSKIEINNIKIDQMTFKSQDLPLARIKKIMKLDEDVKSMMISAEAPILFAKAAEFFIREITLRAWIHTERNKRRTLQRSDITLAVGDGDTDQFDFLIDIVPRDEIKSHGSAKREEIAHNQPMNQVSGNLFGGNTIHLNAPVMSNQHAIISGLVDSTNILQAQASQSNTTVQNQQQVQYVLQIPSNTQLGGHQTIQLQVIPQQKINTRYFKTLLSNAGDSNPLSTPGTVLNGQQSQPQQIFNLASGGGSQSSHGAVVLQPSMMATSGQNQLYSASVIGSLDQHQVSVQPLTTVSTAVVATSDPITEHNGGKNVGHYVISSVKREQDESVSAGSRLHEVI